MPELIFVQARQSPQRILDVFARVLTRHERKPAGQNRHGFKSRQPMEKKNETVRLLRQKDPDGVKQLITHYAPLMRYIVSPILRDGHDIEECISEITALVREKIDSFDEEKGSRNTTLKNNKRPYFAQSVERESASNCGLCFFYLPPRLSAAPASQCIFRRKKRKKVD